jgi:hypothetical protein
MGPAGTTALPMRRAAHRTDGMTARVDPFGQPPSAMTISSTPRPSNTITQPARHALKPA